MSESNWCRRAQPSHNRTICNLRNITKVSVDMRIFLAPALLICWASVGFAQKQSEENLCNPASATTGDNDAGVTVQKVILSGKWGSNEATVFLPVKGTADGAILFSHSAIHSDSGASVDLLPLALTLARAGAAVVVPRRTLTWPPTDQSTNREGAVVVCAEHWLVDSAKVFRNGEPTVNEDKVVVRHGYAYVGPRLCDPGASDCRLSDPFVHDPCGFPGSYCRSTGVVWFPVGETEGGDGTLRMLSDGGLKAAQWLQRQLGLAPIGALASEKSGSAP